MTPKRQRMLFYVFGCLLLMGGGLLVMQAFREHLVFFFTPTDLVAQSHEKNRKIRVGGLVENGSVTTEGATLSFAITDLSTTIQVQYQGIPPALFREGQGVVVEAQSANFLHAADGTLSLKADNVLARHDERYMPQEVADALKEAGHWQEYSDSQALTSPVLFPAVQAPTSTVIPAKPSVNPAP